MEKELEGVRYSVLEPTMVDAYVQKVVDEEWSAQDFAKYGIDLKGTWHLREIDISDIKPNQELLSTDVFQSDLQPRIKRIRDALDSHQEIPPLILRSSDLLIFDGYARYHAFKERNIRKCLAYVNAG